MKYGNIVDEIIFKYNFTHQWYKPGIKDDWELFVLNSPTGVKFYVKFFDRTDTAHIGYYRGNSEKQIDEVPAYERAVIDVFDSIVKKLSTNDDELDKMREEASNYNFIPEWIGKESLKLVHMEDETTFFYVAYNYEGILMSKRNPIDKNGAHIRSKSVGFHFW